jgi:hypothetical protein
MEKGRNEMTERYEGGTLSYLVPVDVAMQHPYSRILVSESNH